MWGRGELRKRNGYRYTGELRENKFHGHGEEYWPDGTFYKGVFVDGLKTGRGQILFTNGDTYEGEFFEGKMHGFGRMTSHEGS